MRCTAASFLLAGVMTAMPFLAPTEEAVAPAHEAESSAQGDEKAQAPGKQKPDRARGGREFYRQNYTFTEDWFSPRIPNWDRILEPYKKKPDIHYLEVGIFEGRSALWMLENVVNHPTSTLTGIDTFEIPRLKHRWLSNVVRSKQGDRVNTIKGYSQVVMRTLPLESYDIIYIDGGHMAHDVLADATLAWDLLKPGGILIFDDFQLGEGWGLPPEMRPHDSIRAFLTSYRMYLEVIHRDYQIFIRKVGPACPTRRDCFRLGGGYIYQWDTRELFQGKKKQKVDISKREQELIAELIRTRAFGETDFTPSDELRADATFLELCERLELQF